MRYPVLWAGLFLIAFGFITGQLAMAAMALFPIPVALFWAAGQPGKSLGLVVCAALSALLATFSPTMAAAFVYIALLGLALGAGLTRGWPFGRCVALLALGFAMLAWLALFRHWPEAREAATISLNALVARVESYATAENQAVVDVAVEQLKRLDLNWPFFVVGFNFGVLLLCATALVTLCFAWARRLPGPVTPHGKFSELRAPDWLVWLAIACALLWFADRRWDWPPLRMVSWNGAVGLVFVYWLNGLAIVLYGLGLFKAPKAPVCGGGHYADLSWPVAGLVPDRFFRYVVRLPAAPLALAGSAAIETATSLSRPDAGPGAWRP